jgi:hypothetical protein
MRLNERQQKQRKKASGGNVWLMQALLIRALLLLQLAAFSAAQETSSSSSVDSPHGPMQVACESCHTASAWRPIRAKPDFDHNKTSYPLRGLHSGVSCEECHVNPVFSNAGSNCQDCHADIHRRRNGAQCDTCHRVSGWQVLIQSINEHQDRFPLIGAHAAVDCYSCHKAGAIGQFNRQGLSTECVSCHLKAFQKATAPNHQALGYSTDCLQCHTSMDGWATALFPRAKVSRGR